METPATAGLACKTAAEAAVWMYTGIVVISAFVFLLLLQQKLQANHPVPQQGFVSGGCFVY
jgi:hypothetical protein